MINSTKRHFVCRGTDFDRFWSEYLAEERQVLFVFGMGFDPRSLDCLKKITKYDKRSAIKYKSITYDYDLSGEMRDMLYNNQEDLIRLELPDLQEMHISTYENDGNLTSTAACKVLDNDLDNYSDLVVDVTSMPTGVYFPLIRDALSRIKKSDCKTQVFLTVSEDSKLDSKIRETSDSEYSSSMYKFGTSLAKQSLQNTPRVWIPILGHHQNEQLGKIMDKIEPKETIPILPTPSSDPYSARDIAVSYSKIFDRLLIEPRNIAYSDERNPSETCAKITSIASSYYELYKEAGGCIIVLSPLASKLLCVGCLMAACELLDGGKEVGVEYVPGHPRIDGGSECAGTPFVVQLGENYEW